jgi:alkylation response protein AidB-like acyl-CoA dehydrogenase
VCRPVRFDGALAILVSIPYDAIIVIKGGKDLVPSRPTGIAGHDVAPQALTDREFVNLDRAEFATHFTDWLDANAAALLPFRDPEPADIVGADALSAGLVRLLYDAGWGRLGWPAEFGGIGGSMWQRATVYDLLATSGVCIPDRTYALEILAPTLIAFAPALGRAFVPRYLCGDEVWCQGFSEPEAGSDLAALRCSARLGPDGFLVSGQKIWTSHAQFSQRCLLLVRTGTAESRHRGLTMLLVDLDLPGIEVRPIRTATGSHELCEVFFDDVLVPGDRLIGDVNGGWAVAMYLLQLERGVYAWMRQAALHRRLALVLEQMQGRSDSAAEKVGELYLALAGLRIRCAETLERLSRGEFLGPEVSVDKLLLSYAEQLACDTARELLFPLLETGDGAWAEYWRSAWYFSRAATILGGTAEVQRGLVAQRVLGLPREMPHGR